MYPQVLQPFRAPRSYWPQISEVEQPRFVVGGGLHFATSAAALGTLLCVTFLAHAACAEGKTLDFTWFELGGRVGAPAMPVLQTFRSVLPIAFVLPVLVWLYSWLAEGAWQGEPSFAPYPARRMAERHNPDDDLPLRWLAVAFGHVGAGILLSLMIYVTLAGALAGWRRAPQFEIALDALVVTGLFSCMAALLVDRVGRMMRAVAATRG